MKSILILGGISVLAAASVANPKHGNLFLGTSIIQNHVADQLNIKIGASSIVKVLNSVKATDRKHFSLWSCVPVCHVSTDCNPVPEPATMAVLGIGAFGLMRKRRAR